MEQCYTQKRVHACHSGIQGPTMRYLLLQDACPHRDMNSGFMSYIQILALIFSNCDLGKLNIISGSQFSLSKSD